MSINLMSALHFNQIYKRTSSGVGTLGGSSYKRQRSVRHLVGATEGVRRMGDVIDHPQA